MSISSALRERFASLERALAADPANDATREALLEMFIEADQPADLPGASLPWLVGHPLPKVAVLTPYHREPAATLARCAVSVRNQTIPALHVFIADGYPQDVVDTWGVMHLRLPRAYANWGDTPRAIGGEAALDAGCTAIAYLDADNFWRPRHLESLLARHAETGAAVCHAARTLHDVDGRLFPLLEPGDNVVHVDTNCLLVTERALHLVPRWRRWPRELSVVGDRMFWAAVVASGTSTACTGALTVAYTADRAAYYRALGEPVPASSRPDLDFSSTFAWFDGLDTEARAALDREQGFAIAPLVEARRRAIRR